MAIPSFASWSANTGSTPTTPTPTGGVSAAPKTPAAAIPSFKAWSQESAPAVPTPVGQNEPFNQQVSGLVPGVPYEPKEKAGVAKKIWYGLGSGAKGFLQQIGTGINEYNKFFYNKLYDGKDVFGDDYEKTYQRDKQILDKYADVTRAKLEARLGTEGADSFVTQATQGLVQGAGQIASFFVNPVVGFSTIAAQTIGAGKNAYDEAYTSSIAQGMDEAEARRIANINGIATGLINTLEIIPVGRAVGMSAKLAGGSLKKGVVNTATRLLKDAAIEVGTEGIQQAGQDITAKLTYDDQRNVVKNVVRSVLTSIPAALLFAGVGEGGKRANDKMRNEIMKQAADEMQTNMVESGIPVEKAKAISDNAVAQYAVMGDQDVFDMPQEIMNNLNTTPTPPATPMTPTPEGIPESITPEQAMAAAAAKPPVAAEMAPTPAPKPAEAERGTSKIAKSVEVKSVTQGLTKGFKDLAGYDKITIKDQAERASQLVNENIDLARAILRGEQELPAGLKGTSLIKGIEDYIIKHPDAEMAYELANSPLITGTSEAAQELRLAAERDPDSVTSKLQEIKKAREKKSGAIRTTKARAVSRKLVEATKEINLPKQELEWDNFLDSITC